MVIAVDFDGTIVEHKYPQIGKDRTFAFETLKSLQKSGHQLILWTYRSGPELQEAVEYCRSKGIEFYAVNSNYPEEVFDVSVISRKIVADVYIDDRNIGGFIGWGEIWQILNQNASQSEKIDFVNRYNKSRKRTFCGFLRSVFCKNEEL
jgi:hydroxymethylpyrimidine pyrophosphatase-like HAD family hydrolase